VSLLGAGTGAAQRVRFARQSDHQRVMKHENGPRLQVACGKLS